MSHVLVADDELPFRQAIDRLLQRRGHATELVESGEAALDAIRARRPDLVLLDVQMPGIGGLEALSRLHRSAPDLPVVIMTAAGSIEVAVEAFKCGAVDFVTKPFDVDKLFAAVDAAVRPPSAGAEAPVLIGESRRFREALDLARVFARPDINILLLGETGTGKELFARAVHVASKRSGGPFVPVDCSVLSTTLIESELFGHEKGSFTGATATRIGHFERANHGTLFLDEIGNLDLSTQAKLLRVLQERTMERVGGRETVHLDIRVISATNVNLPEAVARGSFRGDLYYRLKEMMIPIPPLRERDGDVTRLAEHFLHRYAKRYDRKVPSISPAAARKLEEYGWAGNVRELESVMKCAVILAEGPVMPEHLRWPEADPEPSGRASSFDATPRAEPHLGPAPPGGGGRLRVHVDFDIDITEGADALATIGEIGKERAERALLEAVLRERKHNLTQLARLLKVDPKTLRAKLRKYGLVP